MSAASEPRYRAFALAFLGGALLLVLTATALRRRHHRVATISAPSRGGTGYSPAHRIGPPQTFETLATRTREITFREPPPGRRGYDEQSVDAFLDEIVIACEARRVIDPGDIRNVAFRKPAAGRHGYDEQDVDEFLDEVEAAMEHLGRLNP